MTTTSKLSDLKQQPFCSACGLCELGIQTGHREVGLSLRYDGWGLSWEPLWLEARIPGWETQGSETSYRAAQGTKCEFQQTGRSCIAKVHSITSYWWKQSDLNRGELESTS